MISRMIIQLLAMLMITHVEGACSYYANKPMQTCLKGTSISNYYYCNNSNFIYHRQYDNGICNDPPAYDNPLCDPDDAECVGSCSGDPCEYISINSYGSPPCNKSEDEFQEITYLLDYCNSISGNPDYSSFKYECSAVGQLTFSQFTDDSCTDIHYTIDQQISGLAPTSCQDASVVSNSCSSIPTKIGDNIQCPHYGNKPLNVCEGRYSSTETSYANYYYCNSDGWLQWKQYTNSDCSQDPAYDSLLCDSKFSDCYTKCDGDTCDYFVQRQYTTAPSCNPTTDDWNEVECHVSYPIGYCISLTTTSLMAECNDYGQLVYSQYSDADCVTETFTIDIDLSDTQPTIYDGGCTVTYIYAQCPVLQTPTTTEDTKITITSEDTTEMMTTSTTNGGIIVPIYDFECPHYASTPLDVCVGHKEDISYSNYFYCNDNDELVRNQYGNTDCSDFENPASITVLCDSSDDDCYTTCGGDKCDYVIHRAYTICGDKTGDYNELSYPVGYCIDLPYGSDSIQSSIKYECNQDGNVSYKRYFGSGCDEAGFDEPEIVIEIGNTLPGIDEGDCIDRFVYATCETVEISSTDISSTDMSPSDKSQGFGYSHSSLFVICFILFVIC